ncbi:hypothetical protein [Streptomyces sp. NPDC015131]
MAGVGLALAVGPGDIVSGHLIEAYAKAVAASGACDDMLGG